MSATANTPEERARLQYSIGRLQNLAKSGDAKAWELLVKGFTLAAEGGQNSAAILLLYQEAVAYVIARDTKDWEPPAT